MTGTDEGITPTLVEEARADPSMSVGLAAARGAVEASALIVRVFEASGLTRRELAARAGVTEGRVSQILGGEENLRASTVARYLEAMGYRLGLSAISQRDGSVLDTHRRMPSRRHANPAVFARIEPEPQSMTEEHFATLPPSVNMVPA